MAITTLAQLQTAPQQSVTITKTQSRNINNFFASVFDLFGDPIGTLAGSNKTNGVVPTSSDTGYPKIKSFATGSQGYLKTVNAKLNSFGRITLFDRLFLAGAYLAADNVTLTSQPSFASRVPNSDYSNLEIWLEIISNFNGTPVINIGYTNESGVSLRSTTTAVSLSTICQPVPLQAGDSGVQKIDSVSFSGTTAGSLNVMILRRLHDFTLRASNETDIATMFDNFMLEPIYETSALYILSLTPASGTGLPRVQVQIAEG